MHAIFLVQQPQQGHAGKESPLLLPQQRGEVLHILADGEELVGDYLADALSQRGHFVDHRMAKTAHPHQLSEFQLNLLRLVFLLGQKLLEVFLPVNFLVSFVFCYFKWPGRG